MSFPTRSLRACSGGVYLAGPPGANEWDTTVSFADDASWLVAAPCGPAPGGTTRTTDRP
ncbi:hypothetical protein [Micromonospora cremea]|uniref:hypothetical protein n=1 Tax=Micromonospora cremea TaxID=709881 RepID=UPI00135640E0